MELVSLVLVSIQALAASFQVGIAFIAIWYSKNAYERDRMEKQEIHIQGIIHQIQERLLSPSSIPPGHNVMIDDENQKIKEQIRSIIEPILRDVFIK